MPSALLNFRHLDLDWNFHYRLSLVYSLPASDLGLISLHNCVSHFLKVLSLSPCKIQIQMGLPGGAAVKNPPANTGDMALIPGLGRSPGEGSGNPLQYSSLGNLMDRGAWWAIVHGAAEESDIIYRLNSSNRYRYIDTCICLCI